ncbi:MAG: hypothetical protein AB7I37_12180 [Pirellulales bacterium]
MLTLSRRLIRSLRTVFGRAGEGSRRPRSPQVSFQADQQGLKIQCRAEDFGVEYQMAGPQPSMQFTIPLESLREFESSKDRPVTLSREGKIVVAQWDDHGIPQRNEFDVADDRHAQPLAVPAELVQIGNQEVFPMLADVTKCCANDHGRYALNCIQLRGKQGEAAATDGRQLLVVGGIDWPWQDDVLVLGSRLFASQELDRADPVSVGRSDSHVVFRIGLWTIWLPIAKDVKFPNLENVIPNPDFSMTRIALSRGDAEFLGEMIPRLPRDEDTELPVTMHINGQAVIRARGKSGPIMELTLANSTTTGPELQLKVGRDLLRRAVQLGFHDIRFVDDKMPVVCLDGQRRFIWQPLGSNRALGAEPDAVRISSPLAAASSVSQVQKERPIIPMKTTSSPPVVQSAPASAQATSAAATSNEGPSDPIAVAQALKGRIREALTDVSDLIVSLKRERRKNQALRSTLASLRELQKVA